MFLYNKRVKHSKIKFLSTHGHVISSMFLSCVSVPCFYSLCVLSVSLLSCVDNYAVFFVLCQFLKFLICVLCHCCLVLIIMLFLCLVSVFHVFNVFLSCVIVVLC